MKQGSVSSAVYLFNKDGEYLGVEIEYRLVRSTENRCKVHLLAVLMYLYSLFQ